MKLIVLLFVMLNCHPLLGQFMSREAVGKFIQTNLLSDPMKSFLTYDPSFVSLYGFDFGPMMAGYVSVAVKKKMGMQKSSPPPVCQQLSAKWLQTVSKDCALDMGRVLCGAQDLIEASQYTCIVKNGTHESTDVACEENRILTFSTNTVFAQMLDSMGKFPAGEMTGNYLWLGDFSECKRINTTLLGFNHKFCTVKMGQIPAMAEQFAMHCQGQPYSSSCLTNTPKPITWGLCLSSVCTAKDIAKITTNVWGSDYCANENDVTCLEQEPVTSSAGGIFYIIIVVIIVLIVLAGTSYDMIYYGPCLDDLKERRNRIRAQPVNSQRGSSNNVLADETIRSSPTLTPRVPTVDEFYNAQGIGFKMLLAVSLVRSGKRIFDLKRPENDELKCLHAIRFLSATWVVLGHVYFLISGYLENSFAANDLPNNFVFQIVANSTLSADTFFLLAGLLLSYKWFWQIDGDEQKLYDWRFWAKFYVHKFIRLTPVYMIVIGFTATMYQNIGEGPLYNPGKSGSYANPGYCQNNWWTNLLYINNLVKTDEPCLGWSWFLANYMQFYIISPLILMALYLKPLVGYLVSVGVIATTCLANALVIVKYDFPPTLTFVIDQKEMMYMNPYYEHIYIRPYFRIGPFLIGLLMGYFLYARKSEKRNAKQNSKVAMKGPKGGTALLLWIVALFFCLATLFGLYEYSQGNPMAGTVDAFYSCLNRVAWSFGVAIFIFLCVNGSGGFVNWLLCFNMWIPLSRLSYCLFLVHPLMILYGYMLTQQPFYLRGWNMFYLYMSSVFISVLVSIVVTVFFEQPFIGLEKLVLADKEGTYEVRSDDNQTQIPKQLRRTNDETLIEQTELKQIGPITGVASGEQNV